MAAACGEFIVRCFHARTNAHILHLKSRSYSQHVALKEFYEEVIPLVDKLAEAYQGQYGIISTYPAKQMPMTDEALILMEDLVTWIEKNRDDICDESYCQNIIDEVVALIRSTQYKLRFLK